MFFITRCFYSRKPLYIRLFCLLLASISLSSFAHTKLDASDFEDIIEFNPDYGLPEETEENNTAELDLAVPLTLEPEQLKPTPFKPAPIKRIERTHSGTDRIAIIIDDIGYNYAQGLEAIALPGAITYAIIPHSPKAEFFALEAKRHNKEIMLHAPMSTVHNTPLGEHGLTESMSETTFKAALNHSLDSLPDAIGVNNHMGSLLTQKSLPMAWVMQALQARSLYFIDSRTTSESVAWQTAQDFNIPSLKRDVFLDHTPTTDFIDQQFKKLTHMAKRKGYALAIAHPYPETINYLKQQLPKLKEQNIELVSASTLVFEYSPNLMSPKYTKNVTQITKLSLE